MDLMKDLQQRKELELRARLEKEQIFKTLKDLDSKQLTTLERERKKELERLAGERESLRQREQRMLDEVKNMETQLMEQERQFKQARESTTTAATRLIASNPDFTNETEIRKKELQFAKERGTKVVEVKAQRDKLEKERTRIMEDLDRLMSYNTIPQRRNDAARLAADSSYGPPYSFMQLEPSLKDKLTNDQHRINKLRVEQKNTISEMLPETDDLDVL